MNKLEYGIFLTLLGTTEAIMWLNSSGSLFDKAAILAGLVYVAGWVRPVNRSQGK